MSKQFTDEQIKAYVNAFEEGDAIWSDGKWREVFHEGDSLSIVSLNQYHIKNLYDEGVINGFKNVLESSGVSYRVTTLEDYKLKGGEKIVWLSESESDDFKVFGKTYSVLNSDGKIYYNHGNIQLIPNGNSWGVIPQYKQVNPKEKNDMNEQFNEEQIEAYASAFEEGDAIWCDNQWWKVAKEKDTFFEEDVLMVHGHTFAIKRIQRKNIKPVTRGFLNKGVIHTEELYRVTTLSEYELQGGERVVCLTNEFRGIDIKFGEIFYVGVNDNGTPSIVNEKGDEFIPRDTKLWGIIPRYEQVAPKELQEDSTLVILEQKLTELCKEYDELHKDILEKQRYERKLAEVVTNLEETIDSLKRIGDV